jgi:hypothetical protein
MVSGRILLSFAEMEYTLTAMEWENISAAYEAPGNITFA